LEQVHVTGSLCRIARLSGFAALVAAAAWPAWAAGAAPATQTSLQAETRDLNGRTQATLHVSVAGRDGEPASGAVVIEDGKRQVAGAALDTNGEATIAIGLLPGAHALRAVFAGDDAHQASVSAVSEVSAQASATPDFQISVNPASLSLMPGQSGNVVVSVTPLNASALTAPMFVTLSCSGFPDQSSCTFTPENVEILQGATAAITSNLTVTTAAGTAALARPEKHAVSWAVLLPGVFTLGGIAFATRRRRWLNRLSLMGLVALVSVLGMSACAPRYNYFNHGPPHNLPTPSGNYTLTVTAQSSNGVTATAHSAPLALTVK
jgi:hypothetical protein